jgi:hypothetical protein
LLAKESCPSALPLSHTVGQRTKVTMIKKIFKWITIGIVILVTAAAVDFLI